MVPVAHGDDAVGNRCSTGLRSEQVSPVDDAIHVLQNLSVVIDEVGDTECLHYGSLLGSRQAEVEVMGQEASKLLEVLVDKPSECLLLNNRPTLRHDEDVVSTEALNQLPHRVKRTWHGRRPQEVISPKRRVAVVVIDRIDDHATDIDTNTSGHDDHLSRVIGGYLLRDFCEATHMVDLVAVNQLELLERLP